MKRWSGLAACLILLGLAAPALGDDAPVELTLPTLNGGQFSTTEHRGVWVVLNYWATWCAPCRKEIPELSELHERRDDIVIAGLAYEETTVEAFEAFLQEFPASYPILLVDVYDPPQPFGPPKALPTSIILDPDGRVAKTIVGPVTAHEIEAVVDADR